MALAFHEAGPLQGGPFVHVDCAREEPRLKSALQACLTSAASESGPNLMLAAWGGTLFLDSVGSLSTETQRLLLCLLKRTGMEHEAWLLRVTAGDARDLGAAIEAGRFLPALADALDKIRVDLDRLVAA